MNLTPTTPVDDDNTEPGPFIELSRESWAALSDSTEIDIDEATLDHIRGLGDSAVDVGIAKNLTPHLHTRRIPLFLIHSRSSFRER